MIVGVSVAVGVREGVGNTGTNGASVAVGSLAIGMLGVTVVEAWLVSVSGTRGSTRSETVAISATIERRKNWRRVLIIACVPYAAAVHCLEYSMDMSRLGRRFVGEHPSFHLCVCW